MEYKDLVGKALDLTDESDIVSSHSNLEVTLGYELYGKENKYIESEYDKGYCK